METKFTDLSIKKESLFNESASSLIREHSNFAYLYFNLAINEKNYRYKLSRAWQTQDGKLENIKDIKDLSIQFALDSESEKTVLFFVRGEIVGLLNFRKSGRVDLQVAFSDESGSREALYIIDKIKIEIGGTSLPEKKSNTVEIGICSASSIEDYNLRKKKISVPYWEDIKQNYPKDTREELNNLILNYKPSSSGQQLIIWTGDPGTGKTFGLRSLVAEWQLWCKAYYIADPELFFSSPRYMLGVVSETEEEDYDHYDPDPSLTVEDENSWRLLIMEDAGEFISSDATMAAGSSSLSRFLNLVDGILGQGMKTLVLITSNEKLGRLHPAVTRNGRSSSIIDFNRFPVEEANEWLRLRSPDQQVQRPSALAELFAIANGTELKRAAPIRFGL